MTEHEKGIVLVASIIALLITINFIAIVTGIADSYYGVVTEWLEPWLRPNNYP